MSGLCESAEGTLVIMVCRAKHLPNRRKLDKQSPYVLLRINTIAKKTPSHFRAGQTPEWTFEIRFKLGRERKPIMRLDVLDETKYDPTPIGGTEIDCSKVFLDSANLQEGGKYIWDSWHDLEFRDKPAGKIYLEMTFYPSSPVVPPKIRLVDSSAAPASEVFSEDKTAEFTHLALSQQRSLALSDVFVSCEKKKSFSFRRSDPEKPTRGEPSLLVEQKTTSFERFKNKFMSREKLPAFWSLGRKPKFSFVQEGPLSRRDSFDFHALSLVTFRDKDNGTPPPPPPPHSEYNLLAPPAIEKLRSPIYHAEELEKLLPSSDYLASSPPPPLPKTKLPNTSPSRSPKISPGRSPGRKPPPSNPNENVLTSKTTAVPFSAETFGVEEDDLPTAVYQMGQQVKSLTVGISNKKEPVEDAIDPKHYAPTPSEHLSKMFRLQTGQIQLEDVQVDLRTEQTGYLGEGKWNTKRFSPSIFDRINDLLDKPCPPPKIPQGQSEREYYVLEKENYF